jgi:IS30 family transposase
MTYTYLTKNELAMIESYRYQNISVAIIAKQMKHSR